MPRVPVVPRVMPQDGASGAFSAPGVQPIKDATGAQLAALGGATGALGQETLDLARQLQSDYDDGRVKEAVALWSEAASKAAYDPTEGYLHTVGKASLDRRESFDKSLADTRLDAERILDNEAQRLAFREWVGAREVEYAKAANIHQADQVRQYNIGQTKALAEQTAIDAVNAYSAFGEQSDEFRRLSNTAVDQARQLSALAGQSPEEGDALARKARTQIAAGIVERLVDGGQAQKAMDYLAQQPQGDIEAEALAKMRKLAQAGIKDDNALRLALAIQQDTLETLQGERGSLAQGEPLSEAQKARYLPMAIDRAQQLFSEGKIDSDSYKAVVANIEANYNRQRKADNEAATSLYDSATATLIANPEMKWSELPVTVRERLAETGKLGDIIAFSDGGNRVATDNDYATWLWQKKAANSLGDYPVDQFMKDSAGRLDPAERKAWAARIADAHGDNASYRGFMSLDDKMNLALLRQPRIQNQGIKMGSAEFTERRLLLSEAVNNELLKLGKKPTAKDEDEAIARALSQTMLTYYSSNMQVPVNLMTPAEKAEAAFTFDGVEVYPANIPEDIRIYIANKLLDAKLPASEENVAREYAAAKQPRTLQEMDDYHNGRVKAAPVIVNRNEITHAERMAFDAAYRDWVIGGMRGPEPLTGWTTKPGTR